MKKKLPIIIISVIILSIIILMMILTPKTKNKLRKENLTTTLISTTPTEEISTTLTTTTSKISTTTANESTTTTKSKEKGKTSKPTTNKTSQKTTNNTTKTSKAATTTTSKEVITTTNTTKSTTTTTTTKRTKIKTETIEETEFIENKYGVDKTKVIKYTIITYSDDTTEKVKKSEKYKYDYSGFNATTNDLKEEAKSIANNNMSTYNEVVAKVNEYREAAGSDPITLDNNLCLAATIRAMELAYADKFDHTRPNGKSFSSILKDFNISYYTAGENIAAGQTKVNAVTETWYKSNGHRENMESKSFNKIGVGKYRLPYSSWGTYWVQIFTN